MDGARTTEEAAGRRRTGDRRRATDVARPDGRRRAAMAEIRPPTGRIQLGKGRIWPEEPAAAAMAEEVGRGRDWRRADGDKEAATGEDEGAATTTAAAEEGGAENGRTAGCCCLRRWKGGKKKWRSMLPLGRRRSSRGQRSDAKGGGSRSKPALLPCYE